MSNRTRVTARSRARTSNRRRDGTAGRSRRAQQRARRRRIATVAIVGAAVAVTVLAVAVADRSPSTAPEGVVDIGVTSRRHVSGTVNYAQSPPAGGDHAPAWQNCGFYDQPIPYETAVHSLEHGAVWIQYAADLPEAERDDVERLAVGDPYVLASPFDGLDSPVVLSAWGRQLALDSVNDPRVDAFLEAFVQGPQTPERGGACAGGVGDRAA